MISSYQNFGLAQQMTSNIMALYPPTSNRSPKSSMVTKQNLGLSISNYNNMIHQIQANSKSGEMGNLMGGIEDDGIISKNKDSHA